METGSGGRFWKVHVKCRFWHIMSTVAVWGLHAYVDGKGKYQQDVIGGCISRVKKLALKMILDRIVLQALGEDMKEYVEQASLHLVQEALQMTPKEMTTNVGPGITHLCQD